MSASPRRESKHSSFCPFRSFRTSEENTPRKVTLCFFAGRRGADPYNIKSKYIQQKKLSKRKNTPKKINFPPFCPDHLDILLYFYYNSICIIMTMGNHCLRIQIYHYEKGGVQFAVYLVYSRRRSCSRSRNTFRCYL